MHSDSRRRASSSASSAGLDAEPPTEICRTLREVVAPARRVVEHEARHGRHEEQPGDAVRLDQAQDLAGVEAGEQHVHAAEPGDVVGRAPAVDVEQRDGVQDHVVAGEAHRQRAVDRVEVQARGG